MRGVLQQPVARRGDRHGVLRRQPRRHPRLRGVPGAGLRAPPKEAARAGLCLRGRGGRLRGERIRDRDGSPTGQKCRLRGTPVAYTQHTRVTHMEDGSLECGRFDGALKWRATSCVGYIHLRDIHLREWEPVGWVIFRSGQHRQALIFVYSIFDQGLSRLALSGLTFYILNGKK